jgi:hypothetical protein
MSMMDTSATVSPWGRMQMLSGAPLQRIEFVPGVPAKLMVGSAPRADLCIARLEVAPRQLDIVWDGAHLWLEDALRLGRTFVGGRLLNEWVAVHGQIIVSFAAVRLGLLANGPPPNSSAPNFEALDRASLLDSPTELRKCETRRNKLTPELLQVLHRARG